MITELSPPLEQGSSGSESSFSLADSLPQLNTHDVVMAIQEAFPIAVGGHGFPHDKTISLLREILPLPIYVWSLCLSRLGNIQTLKQKQSDIKFTTSSIRWYLLNRLRIHECKDLVHVFFRILYDIDCQSTEPVPPRSPRKVQRRRTLSLSQPCLHPPSEDCSKTIDFRHVKPLVAEVSRMHKALHFLWEVPNIIPYYLTQVAIRIFRQAQAHAQGIFSSRVDVMNMRQLRYCELLESLELISSTDDIDDFDTVFSHRHFYVILRKFCELDTDSDGMLTREDLLRIGWDLSVSRKRLNYANLCVTPKVADRIVHIRTQMRPNIMFDESERRYIMFEDFSNFILSEIDIFHPASLNFWFTVFDCESYGILTEDEIREFYSEIEEQFFDNDEPAIPFEAFLDEVNHMFSIVDGKGFRISRRQMLARPDQANTLFSALKCVRGYYTFECDDHIISVRERKRRKVGRVQAYQQRFVQDLTEPPPRWTSVQSSLELASYCDHLFDTYSQSGNHDIIENIVHEAPRRGMEPPPTSDENTTGGTHVTVELEGEHKKSKVVGKVKNFVNSLLSKRHKHHAKAAKVVEEEEEEEMEEYEGTLSNRLGLSRSWTDPALKNLSELCGGEIAWCSSRRRAQNRPHPNTNADRRTFYNKNKEHEDKLKSLRKSSSLINLVGIWEGAG